MADLAASLQAAIADCLADRTKQAMTRFRDEFSPADGQQPLLVIAGGVAANHYIFGQLQDDANAAGFQLSVPPAILCTDNAAMIAWAALERLEAPDALDFAHPRCRSIRMPVHRLDEEYANDPYCSHGAGSWGSAIATALMRANQQNSKTKQVTVLARRQESVDALAEGRCLYLPKNPPSMSIAATTDPACLDDADLILLRRLLWQIKQTF